MKDKTYKYLTVFFYLASLFILLFCIRVRIHSNIYLSTDVRLILLLLVCIFIYIGGYILVKKLSFTKKILKINLVIYFCIYIVTIFTLTLFDEIYGRQGFKVIKWDKDLLKVYMNTSFNIVPFSTIKLFINGYIKELVTFKDFMANIFGNLCAFMPFALFIPLLINKIDKYYKFIIVMAIIIISIEILQFITMSGSCDIDDFILNILGVSIAYFILKIKCINRFINKVFLLE